jgi:putative spermidine/putrescine transport system substrate-binding protein
MEKQKQHSRRAFLVGSAAALATPAVHGQATITVNLLGYIGAFKDIYIRTVIEPFQRANPRITVAYNDGGNSVQMIGLLRSQRNDPQLDVAIVDASITLAANREGVFDPIPPADVPALADLYPLARDMFQGYGPAFTFDHYTILYDKRRIPSMTSLRELWDPRYRDQIAIAGPPNVQAFALTLIVNHMEGADYHQTIDPAIAKLRELAPNVQTFEPSPDGTALMLAGGVSIATGWNARSQIRSQDVPHLGIMLPSEGTISVMDTLNLVKNAKNRAAALAFMNYALGGEAQTAFSNAAFYGPTTSKATVPAETFARMTSAPDNLRRVLPVDWSFVSNVRDQWTARWRREVISASRR